MDLEKNTTAHESYGLLGFYRAHGSGNTALFGSSIKHSDTIFLKLQTAKVHRELNRDWYFADKFIAEIEMSQSQFADLITSLNQGDGVPVTIRWLNGKKMEPCPFEDKTEQHVNEFREHQSEINTKMQNLIQNITDTFDKKSITKKDKESIMENLKQIQADISNNSNFAVKQFCKQMDQTVTEAKAEIEAFAQNKLTMIANQALVEQADEIQALKSPVTIDIEAPKE